MYSVPAADETACARGEYGSYAPSGGGPAARIRQSSVARITQLRPAHGTYTTVQARIWHV